MNNKYFLFIHGMITLILFILGTKISPAQDNEWNTWGSIKFSKDIGEKFNFSLTPELRFTDQFDIDEYLVEAGLEYQPVKFLELGAQYRFLINERETKSTEYFHRVAFDAKGKYEIKRFNFQLRTRYTNYNEFDSDDDNETYLRYRLKTEYNLKKSKLTPVVSIELFHQLKDKEINKIRYSLGAEYKINKHHAIGLNYHIQDYLNKDYQKNILALEYKIKF